ncbi:Branched-chain amino acid aminotransferasecytosolic [Aphelenchoides avenae]|nr:Branched-chain amino acid aminotransferasecytosolic [Aphelenchus avenae]
MVDIDWTHERGWDTPKIRPLEDLRLHPAAKALHYAIEAFEGIKAFRGVDDRIRIFRMDINMRRLMRSAEQTFNPDELSKITTELVRLDKDWVPHQENAALYLRPTIIGTEPQVGLAASKSAKLFVITCLADDYYGGAPAVTLLADPQYVRAFPGGVGGFKMGCNYAPTIKVSEEAATLGCHQVMWLHTDAQLITEAGTMNVFIYWINEHGDKELVTAPLKDGIILDGVTRRSILELASELKQFQVSERYLSMADIHKALKENRLLEMFGSGTAVVIAPIERILHRQADGSLLTLDIPTAKNSPNLMQKLLSTIQAIQVGRIERPGWSVLV